MSDTPVATGCLCCGAGHQFTEHIVDEAMFRNGERFAYRECSRCGSLQLAAVPPNLSDYYSNDDYYSFQGRTSRYTKLFQLRRFAVVRFLLRLNTELFVRTGLGKGPLWTRIAGLRTSDRILDLGCGSGHNVLALHHFGYSQVTGADPFLDADRELAPGVHIRKQSHEELRGSYDWVLMHHSFEHVADPRATLQSCRRILSAGGRALIRMPIMGQAAWRRYGTDWVQIDAPRHIALYSLRAVRELAESEGFDVERIAFDSTAFQFWGSELVAAGLPHAKGPQDLAGRVADWTEDAERLNEALDGDQAVIVLRARSV